jgi:valyl-tRNA synthetase
MARMILMSTYAISELPFRDVYIHGILRDKSGKKFSKSLGTGIDPLKIIETYGTDALRISLIAGITPGNDAKFYEEKVAGARNFVNKLWNISRFILTTTKEPSSPERPTPATLADTWILSRFDATLTEVTNNLEHYEFSYAIEALKSFTWNDFADWYVEIAKIEGSKDAILRYILRQLLILWHPFAPFITEHINSLMQPDKMLMVAAWPENSRGTIPQEGANEFMQIIKIVEETRSIKADYRLAATTIKELIIRTGPEFGKIVRENEAVIQKLAHVSAVTVTQDTAETKTSARKIISAECEIIMPLEGLLDIKKEKEHITEEQSKLKHILLQIEERLSNTDFTRKAPEHVIAAEKERQEEIAQKIKKMDSQMSSLHD